MLRFRKGHEHFRLRFATGNLIKPSVSAPVGIPLNSLPLAGNVRSGGVPRSSTQANRRQVHCDDLAWQLELWHSGEGRAIQRL
jgi:hypothetical protein